MEPDYAKTLQEFVARLTAEQSLNGPGTYAAYESGRKYDKILIHLPARPGLPQVRYFVKKSTGDIYGAKSGYAPNLNWWFGDIYNAEKWDWSGIHGRPINDERIRAVKQYAGHIHYIKI